MNNLIEIIVNIIKNPNIPRFYRELQNHLTSLNKENEALAICYLLREKFNENTNSDKE